MAIFFAIVKAFTAALAVWRQERSLANSPAMVKNKLEIARQEAQDALNQAEAVLANPNASPEEHRAALEKIRIAGT